MRTTVIFTFITIGFMGILVWRFKILEIKERHFWPSFIILLVALIGLWEVQIKYNEFAEVKKSIEELTETSVEFIAYSVANLGRFSSVSGKEGLKREIEYRDRADDVMRGLNFPELKRKKILSELNKWIDFDKKQLGKTD